MRERERETWWQRPESRRREKNPSSIIRSSDIGYQFLPLSLPNFFNFFSSLSSSPLFSLSFSIFLFFQNMTRQKVHVIIHTLVNPFSPFHHYLSSSFPLLLLLLTFFLLLHLLLSLSEVTKGGSSKKSHTIAKLFWWWGERGWSGKNPLSSSFFSSLSLSPSLFHILSINTSSHVIRFSFLLPFFLFFSFFFSFFHQTQTSIIHMKLKTLINFLFEVSNCLSFHSFLSLPYFSFYVLSFSLFLFILLLHLPVFLIRKWKDWKRGFKTLDTGSFLFITLSFLSSLLFFFLCLSSSDGKG